VLRLVGQSLKELVKGQDITARYGGEEFAAHSAAPCAVGCRSAAPHGHGEGIEEEIHRRAARPGHDLRPIDDTDALIERADACLYAAKRSGRNRVICEIDPEYVEELRSQVA
jgi:diguanylate cyclase